MLRINRKLLLATIVGSAAFASAIWGIRYWQLQKQSDFYFSQAKSLVESGDIRNAVNQFRRGLVLEPKNFNAYFELSKCLKQLDLLEPAYLAAQRAEQINLDSRDAQLLLAELALDVGRFEDAERRASKLLDETKPEQDLLLLRARARTANKKFALAVEDYEKAIRCEGPRIVCFVELASVLSNNLNQTDNALRVMADAKAKAQSPEELVEVGHWYLRQFSRRSISSSLKEIDTVESFRSEAIQIADLLISKHPEFASSFIFAARTFSSSNDASSALAIVDRGISSFENATELFAIGAENSIALNDLPKAEGYLERGLEKSPNEATLLWQLAEIQLKKQSWDECKRTSQRLRNVGYAPSLVSYLEARVLAGQGFYLDAIKQLEGVRTELVDSPELQRVIDITLADCFESIGNTGRQISALRRAASLNSAWLFAREKLAIALLKAGRVEEATEEYRALAQRPGVPIGAPLNLARLLVMQNIGRDENRRDWETVSSLLDQVESSIGRSDEIIVLRAEVLLAKNEPEQARKLLVEKPNSDLLLAARILLEINQSQFDDAFKIIADAGERINESAEVRRAYLLAIVSDPQSNEKELADKIAVAPENWKVSDRVLFYESVLPFLVGSSLSSAAKEAANNLAELDRSNLTAIISQIEISSRLRDKQKLTESLDLLEKLSGRSATWYYGKAVSIVLNNDTISTPANTQAQAFLNEAALQTPDWANIPALSGWLYDQIGDSESAILKYTLSLDLGLRRIDFIQRLLSLLAEKGRFSEADAVIRRVSQASPALSSSMSRLASEISVQLANIQRAVALAKDAAEKSQSSSDYVWLAQLCDMNRDGLAAESAFQKAIALSPDEPTVQVAWIRFLSRSSRIEQARETAKTLESKLNSAKSSDLLVLAECYLSLDMVSDTTRLVSQIDSSGLSSTSEIQRQYSLMVSTSSSESRISWLSSILKRSTDNDVDRETIIWANRQQALEWIYRNVNLSNAKSALEENLRQNPKSFDDRRAYALLLATTEGGENPTKSLSLFEALISEGWTPQGDDSFLIGELYSRAGDWSKASRFFLQILGNPDKRKPVHLKRYATLLLERHDPKEAELWVDRLIEEGVVDKETADLFTECLFQRKQWDELFSLLLKQDNRISKRDWIANTISLRERYSIANTFLTRMKREGNSEAYSKNEVLLSDVEKKLRESDQFPSIAYATELVVRNELKTGIASAINAIPHASIDEITAFADKLFEADSVELSDYSLIKTSIESHPSYQHDPTLRVISARISEQTGDFKAAEKKYRELLTTLPTNAVCLNNLANLLALRDNKSEEAFELINKAISVEGETIFLRDTRAICFLSLEKFESATKELEAIVNQMPHPVLRFHLAVSYLLSNNPSAAKRHFLIAKEAGLSRAQIHVLERSHFEKLSSL